MSVIECGTIEVPENVLKALIDADAKKVVRLLQEFGEEAYYWFTLSDVARFDPHQRYSIYANPEVKCRFNIVGMALVFGSETMIRTVLDNVAKKCMTARCRVYFLNQNDPNDFMDLFTECEAPYLLTKASLFHNAEKFHLLELMRREYGLDLSLMTEVMSYDFEFIEGLDLKAEQPWPFGDDDEDAFAFDPPMDHFCRRQSVLAAIAHELPLDMLDKYCKLYPNTLLPDGCFHLGRCLKVGDFDRLKVLFNNGLHHRPEYAKREWTVQKFYPWYPSPGREMYTNKGEHQLSEYDFVHLMTMQDIQLEGCSKQTLRHIKRSELKMYFAWLAAFQFCGGYEFEFVDGLGLQANHLGFANHIGFVGAPHMVKMTGLIPIVKRAMEEWNSQPKTLYFLARNVLRTSIPINGFENHIREMIGCRPIEERVGCNLDKMNEYFKVVTGPPAQDEDANVDDNDAN